jgi:Tol biopolymer transport system component
MTQKTNRFVFQLPRHWWQILLLLLISMAAILAYAQTTRRGEFQLTLVDREGHRTLAGGIPNSTFAPRVSPDGNEVIYDTQEDGQLWIAKLSNLASRRQLTSGGSNRGEIWSGDGKRILYITDDGNQEALFWRAADGTGKPELLQKPVRAAESWSPLEPGVSFITLQPGGDYDIWTYSIAAKRAMPFYGVPGSAQHSSHYSPDGHWIAYASAESGRLEIYVRPFPAGTPAVQVTHAGGEHPLWSPDQKEIYFDVNHQLYAVPIQIQPTFRAGSPVQLPISGFIQGPLRRQYDLMPDGKHFLMMFQ